MGVFVTAIVLLHLLILCSSQPPLDTIVLPPGFSIEVYADSSHQLTEPRKMDIQISKNGSIIVYVASFNTRKQVITALIDGDANNKVDSSYYIWKGTEYPPASLAVNPISKQLYFNTADHSYICDGNANEQILQFNDTDHTLSCNIWLDMNYSSNGGYLSHGLHYMRFEPITNNLCIAFGNQCNECTPQTPTHSQIRCYNGPNSINPVKIPVYGIRNSYGIDFHPITHEMWFSDNGRDNLELPNSTHQNQPDDELNHVVQSDTNVFFGYPWCHSEGCGDPYQRDINCVIAIGDPDIGTGNTSNCANGSIVLAKQPLGPHVGAIGMMFYNGTMFPAKYKNAIFVAEHGSWDRQPLIGYRVSVVFLDDNSNVIGHDIFAQGWLNSTTQNYWGRPNDVNFLPDGSMLIADDGANIIYRVTYDASKDTDDAQRLFEEKQKQFKDEYHAAALKYGV